MTWARARDSLWFIPALFTLSGCALAVLVVAADRHEVVGSAALRSWLFAGGAEGARGVLGAIAGGLITVTGVVFSVTIVALQLASSQYTPRLLRDFTGDRANQVVLGIFIGTFTYCLLVLRVLRAAHDGVPEFVPRIGVTLAVLLLMVSIGSLIFFIDHSARSIGVSTILERVARRTLDDVRRAFPEEIGEGAPAAAVPPAAEGEPVTALRSGYLQAVDGDALFRLGASRRMVIWMEPHIGDFIMPGETLAIVRAPALDDEVRGVVRDAFVLGEERTAEQDVEFGIVEISDIAVKALSPGINDPTTAFHCIDRLGEIVLALGRRRSPSPERTAEGGVHFIAREVGLERAVGVAFEQIRHFGASNPAIARKLLDTLARVAVQLPAFRRDALRAQAEALVRAVRSASDDPEDVRAVEVLAERLGWRVPGWPVPPEAGA